MDNNRDRIKQVIYNRGLWDAAKSYSDEVKDLEVDWVLAFNKWLENDLKNYDYPIIKIGDKKYLVLEIKNILKL